MQITSDKLRAARSVLRLEQTELAHRANVSVVTIRRLEAMDGSKRVPPVTIDWVRKALEQAGAELISEGVRRRHTSQPDAACLYEDLRAITLRSAARLQGPGLLADADLYDEDGLPA